jgi:hypothetical protein
VAQGRASSSRAARVPVKPTAGRDGWFSRHLEGWQPAVLAVLLAGATALVAVPRPIDALEIPEPLPDMSVVAAAARADEALAEGAERARLDVDVLALGSAVFDYGATDASGDDLALGRARKRLIEAAGQVPRDRLAQVLALRAHHIRSFLREIRRWETSGEENSKLAELAGGFTRTVRRNGWADGPEGRPRLRMSAAELAVFFKKHWNDVTGLRGAAFDLSLDEERVFYRFLIRNPVRAPALRPQAEALATLADEHRLKKIGELEAIDPSYPADLARGVVLYRLRRYPLAVEAFRRHLDAHPDGAYTLRAQNYLRTALGRALEE